MKQLNRNCKQALKLQCFLHIDIPNTVRQVTIVSNIMSAIKEERSCLVGINWHQINSSNRHVVAAVILRRWEYQLEGIIKNIWSWTVFFRSSKELLEMPFVWASRKLTNKNLVMKTTELKVYAQVTSMISSLEWKDPLIKHLWTVHPLYLKANYSLYKKEQGQ